MPTARYHDGIRFQRVTLAWLGWVFGLGGLSDGVRVNYIPLALLRTFVRDRKEERQMSAEFQLMEDLDIEG